MTLPSKIHSFLRNCYFAARPGDSHLFEIRSNSQGEDIVCARLDGYAIIPKEIYQRLEAQARHANS